MAWSRSEPKWDAEVEVPNPRDNDCARHARELYRSHFGEVEVESKKRSPATSTSFSVYESNLLDD